MEMDRFDVRLARDTPPELLPFNQAGVLAAAEVHVARRLAGLAGTDDALLATALAVRAPRLGHVYVDLASVARTVTVEAEEPVDLSALPWPEPAEWLHRTEASPLVSVGEDAPEPRPLRLIGSCLYLDRYWRDERQVAADLRELSCEAEDVDTERLTEGLRRVFAGRPDRGQKLAAASAVLRRFAVVAGGPGTGKTTTVARILALLHEQPGDLLVALAAPTGKAAARLEEAVHDDAADLDVAPEVRDRLLAAGASTIHRLLGWRPDSNSRFRHHRGNKLPHDVVIVDETSMVSLSLMARLVEAVRPGARLILVGDPGQLTSIEAGAVLGDVVGPATQGPRMRPRARERLAAVTGEDVPGEVAESGIGDGIVVLDRGHRFGTGIATLAGAVRRGDADAVLDVLAQGPEGVEWVAADPAAHPLDTIREAAVGSARAILAAAGERDAEAALDALRGFRVLCAHRRGEHGVSTWMTRIEDWLAEDVAAFAGGRRWYVGRPLLVTENDYELGLFNGDTGVVVATAPTKVAAAFERRGEIVELSPSRLAAVDTVYAMTIHKSQGSQFGTAAVLLPPASSPILTRELLYTAVTRAQERLIVVGTEETLRAAVARPAARASGLLERLWSR
jgi:exodeoxyribonuclease V alpha subunit